MKILKWLAIITVSLVLVIGIGVVALVYLVDWNNQKDRIQNLVKTHTGRDLIIAGDLSPSVFPWVGISVGEVSLSNAEGFGDRPFASIQGADVKVKLLPLLKRVVELRTVTLDGLELDLQRAADGTTNWDDLVKGTTTTTKTEEGAGNSQVTTEVEGNNATIAALAVGGIDVSDANVSWNDAQAGLDARLSSFDLQTGAIELAKPFTLSTDFEVSSDSMDIVADVQGSGKVVIDLEAQDYSLDGFKLVTEASGAALPNGKLKATLGAEVMAALGEQRIDVRSLTLDTLGIALAGEIAVSDLDTVPAIAGTLSSKQFNPRILLDTLGIEQPVTADENVLKVASLAMTFAASPQAAAIEDLAVRLDDTNLTGTAAVPSLEGEVPPLRFDLALDKIDVDRYLPPASDADDGAGDGEAKPAPAPGGGTEGGDTPIELPVELMRSLDVDGKLTVGELVASGLVTTDIVVPVKAANGKLGVAGMLASLYQGKLDTDAGVDVSGATPVYSLKSSLAGIQAEPLIADLTQEDSFLSGAGRVAADLTTAGDTVDALTAGLDGTFDTAFTDGSINGINLGFQLRRAKAALTGQKLAEDEKDVKTDFTSLEVGGRFADGVMTSDDLDMRSPLLRLGGAGTVDLPGEKVDYTLTTLIAGTLEGQGGDDLAALKGLELKIPIRGTFEALAANPAGVIFNGLKDGFTGDLKDSAKALADEQAKKLRAEGEARAKALEEKTRAQLKEKEGELKRKLNEKLDQQVSPEDKKKLEDGLRGLLNR